MVVSWWIVTFFALCLYNRLLHYISTTDLRKITEVRNPKSLEILMSIDRNNTVVLSYRCKVKESNNILLYIQSSPIKS